MIVVRKVFFSFDYDDVMRVELIRNMGSLRGTRHVFSDAAGREQVKRETTYAIERWIIQQMHGTSVTVVLIGKNTHRSRWVNYEIKESIRQGKGLLGIHLYGLEDTSNTLGERGKNPLSMHHGILGSPRADCIYQTKHKGQISPFERVIGTSYYNWINKNIGDWIEQAIRAAAAHNLTPGILRQNRY